MPQAVCQGAKLAYQQFGSGPDLIMVHGLAANRAFWYAQYAQVLKDHFRVTLYDLRGHGYSQRCDTGYSAAAMAGDLRELMDAAEISAAHIVGHSYGGGVGLELAVQHPERVLSLCLMDTKVNRLQPLQRLQDSDFLTNFEREVLGADGGDWSREEHVGLRYLEAIARLRLKGFESLTRDEFTPFAEGRGGQRSAQQYIKLLQTTQAEEEFKQHGASRAELASLPMPLCLLYGEHSRCLQSGRALLELHPRARFVMVPQAGHFFPASHAQIVLQELERFLEFDMHTALAAAGGASL